MFFLDPNYTESRSLWATPKMEKIFFFKNKKSRSSAFWKFLFYQNIMCFDWVMNLFPSWVMFSVKKLSFPAKTAVILKSQNWKYNFCLFLTKYCLRNSLFQPFGAKCRSRLGQKWQKRSFFFQFCLKRKFLTAIVL